MRIEAYNKVDSIYQTSKRVQSEQVKKDPQYDQVEISRQGQDYQIVKKAIHESPDVRMDKVNDIKNRIASGTYNVKLSDVADKLVDSYFDETI